MSQDMIPFQQAALPAYMQQVAGQADINQQASAGIGGESVNHISLAGGRFAVVRGQTKTQLAVWELELIFVLVNPGVNKAYYATKWNPDGEAVPPDCMSDDGVTPRADSKLLQCNTCAACPQNQFGSKINPQTGAQGKACADKKFIAVVAPGQAGGEMLRLQVPVASLGDLGTMLRNLPKVPYYAVVAGVSFDTAASYPKLKFRPIRYVEENEFATILERHNSDEAKLFAGVSGSQPMRIPATNVPVQPAIAQQAPVQQPMQQAPMQQQASEQQAPQQGFGQAPQQQAPAQQPAPGQQAAPQQGFGQAPTQQQAPVQQAAPQQQAPVQQAAPQQSYAPAADPSIAAVFAGQAFGGQPEQQAPQQQAPAQQAPQQTAPTGGVPDVLPSGRVPGRPAPGKKRRTKVEMAEDEAMGVGATSGEKSEEDGGDDAPAQQSAPQQGFGQATQQAPVQQAAPQQYEHAPQQQAPEQQAPVQQQAPQQGFGQAPSAGFGQAPQQAAATFEQPATQPPVMAGNVADAFAGWDD